MSVLRVQKSLHALGYYEDGKYHREPDFYESIRDLIRYLREDGEDFAARLECGRHNIIQQDLVPMAKCDDLSDDEFDIVIRLMVNLCQPAIATMRGKAPADRDEWKMYWELEENLRRAKNAFIDPLFFNAVKKRVDSYFIDTEYDDRDERLRLVVERIVLLIKYIFSINPDTSEGRRTRIEDSSHDRVIMALLESGIDKTLMHIANQPREKEFHVTILDVFALILKEQSAEHLAQDPEDPEDNQISNVEKKKTEEEFRKIIENHTVKEAQKRKSFSRFGGSYVIKGLKGIASNSSQVVFKPIQNVGKHDFCDERKAKKKVARNRRPFEIDNNSHCSSIEVRQKLRDMVVRLIEMCFNRLMKSAKSSIFVQGHLLQRTSQINYFFLVKFVLRFVRLSRLDQLFERISECMGVEAFHENNVQLTEYVENAATLKGKMDAKSFGLKAQYALGAYNELVLIHRHVYEHAREEHDKKMARRALEHIVNVEEYRELPVAILKKFSPVCLSNNFLREVVLTTHHYVRLVERFVKTGFLKKVTKKVAIRKARKPKKTVSEEDNRAEFDTMSTESLEQLWEELARSQLLQILKKEVPEMEDMNPLNWKLEVDDTMAQQFAMLSIQRSLRSRGFPAAVGLYHAARKVWPSEGIFGAQEMDAEEELNELEHIFKADLREVAKQLKVAEEKAQKEFDPEDVDAPEEEYDENEEEETPCWQVKEIDFELEGYITKFANIDVLKWYVFLLDDFAKNSTELNQALVKMLHRIAFDLKLITRLYQVSLFQVFAKLGEHFAHLSKELWKTSPLYELYQFGYHVLKKYFAKFAGMGEDLAIETLFWKGPKECYEIENGYGSYFKNKEAEVRVWTEEIETEVRNLHAEYVSIEQHDGIDVLDFIEHNLSRARTRKQIAKKLIEFGMDLFGAKWRDQKQQMDSVLPVGDIQKWHDEWKSSGAAGDVIAVLQERLAESLSMEVSRKKLIKQLAHMGVAYEKPKREKPLPVWSEELVEELSKLKEQYEEIGDAENLLGVDIVRYVMKRLSEKKPTRQVERHLISLGATVKERPKKERKEKKKSDFLNDESEEEVLRDSEDEDAPSAPSDSAPGAPDAPDAPDAPEDSGAPSAPAPDAPKKNTLMGMISRQSRRRAQLDSDTSSDSESDCSDSEDKAPIQKTKTSSDSDAEDVDIFSGSVAQAQNARELSEQPEEDLFSKPMSYKRRKVVSSSEDED